MNISVNIQNLQFKWCPQGSAKAVTFPRSTVTAEDNPKEECSLHASPGEQKAKPGTKDVKQEDTRHPYERKDRKQQLWI